jgi:hypothetical protein
MNFNMWHWIGGTWHHQDFVAMLITRHGQPG